jgi:TonB family protein
MNTAADKFSPFIATSAVLHGSLFVLVAFGPMLFPKGPVESWGTGADNSGIKATLADGVPGIPLPSPAVVTEAAKPTDTKTLHPPEVAPKEPPKEAPKPAEIKIPERGANTPPKPAPSQPSRAAAAASPAPSAPTNAVPGDGGQAPLPRGQPGAGQASFGGDGTFGSRFPAYVTSMTKAVEDQWYRFQPNSIAAGASRRVYVRFRIVRVGRNAAKAEEIEITQPSGSTALDSSALKAVLNAPLPPLPAAYTGSSVDVRFYFDYTR